jgi:hypothetical protein
VYFHQFQNFEGNYADELIVKYQNASRVTSFKSRLHYDREAYCKAKHKAKHIAHCVAEYGEFVSTAKPTA